MAMQRNILRELPSPDDQTVSNAEICDIFGHKCVRCRRPTDTVHEIKPRSKAPTTWKKFSNRVLLCIACHLLVHSEGARKFEVELTELRQQRLHQYRRL
jgi:5-methylcytosine-specific restriction endonuclease McrA